jgi:hypothetical protein
MKSILYVGAALMIGASIYGFADYKKTSEKKEFKTMYAEPVAADEEEDIITKTVTNPVDVKKTTAITNTQTSEKKIVNKKTTAKKKTKKKGSKEKIFKARFFSRGALDERYIEPIKPKADTEKKDVIIKEEEKKGN